MHVRPSPARACWFDAIVPDDAVRYKGATQGRARDVMPLRRIRWTTLCFPNGSSVSAIIRCVRLPASHARYAMVR